MQMQEQEVIFKTHLFLFIIFSVIIEVIMTPLP